MQSYTTPLHDENSHGADAFGEFAVNCGIRVEVEKPKPEPKWPVSGTASGQTVGRLPTVDEILKGRHKENG